MTSKRRMSSDADSLVTGVTELKVSQWSDICWHLYHALCELIAWQAGDAEPDGEIMSREGVVPDEMALGGSRQRAFARRSSRPQSSAPVGRLKPAIVASHFMEKDQDSFDRDNARRRRVSGCGKHGNNGRLPLTSVPYKWVDRIFCGRAALRSAF